MKKCSLWLILVIVVSCWSGSAVASPPQEESQFVASLEVLNGKVQVRGVQAEKWESVTNRTVLKAGDTIRTKEDGEALVTWFADGTVSLLMPNSKLYINEFRGTLAEDSSFTLSMTLVSGRVFNSVQHLLNPNSKYEVRTQSFISTVRGTVFAVGIEAESTVLMVNEGIVNAAQISNQQDVAAGYWLQGNVDTLLPTPVSIDATRQDALVREYTRQFRKFEKYLRDKDEDGVVDVIDQCPRLKGDIFRSGCVSIVVSPNSNVVREGNHQASNTENPRTGKDGKKSDDKHDDDDGRHDGKHNDDDDD